MASNSRGSGAATGLVTLVALVCLLVPLPTAVVDLLLAANLIGAVLVLLAAASVDRPSELGALPRLLVFAALGRLVLFVSTLRLVLGQGQAGAVIDGFGRIVVGNDLIVGLALFLILMLVQYVVLAKGGERIAEVAARFALDAMPGQQAAIDGEVRGGQLPVAEAQRRRQQLVEEAQIFGSLDGAMRFVRGDTIAGFIVLALALVAGLGIGMWRDGLPIDQAVRRYTLLTIGDGLVMQLPSLLLASAAALMVTRVATATRSRAAAFLRWPALLGAAGIALGLGLLPGLPLWPFLVVALVLAVLAYRRSGPPVADPSDRRPVLAVRLPDEAVPTEHEFRDALGRLVVRLSEQIGIPVPPIALRIDPTLAKGQCVVEVRGVEAARAQFQLDALFVDAAPAALPDKVNAQPATHPIRQTLGSFVSAADLKRIDRNDALGPAEFVTLLVERVIGEHLAELCTVELVFGLVQQLSESHPNLVRTVVPERLSIVTLTDVLRRLLREGISVARLDEIFDLVASSGDVKLQPFEWVERIRAGQRRQITAQFAEGKALSALLLDAEAEELLRDSLRPSERGTEVALEPELHDALLASVADGLANPAAKVVVTPGDLRRHLRRLLEEKYPRLPVLAYNELLPDVEIETVANVTVRA